MPFVFLDSACFLSYVRVQRQLLSFHQEIHPHLENYQKLLKEVCKLSSHIVLCFIMWILTVLWPCALFGSKWLIILVMSLLEKCIESRRLFVSWFRTVGKVLLSLKREHWFRKIWLNNSAFFLKSVMNFFSWERIRCSRNFFVI